MSPLSVRLRNLHRHGVVVPLITATESWGCWKLRVLVVDEEQIPNHEWMVIRCGDEVVAFVKASHVGRVQLAEVAAAVVSLDEPDLASA